MALASATLPGSTVCPAFDFDALSVWFGYKHVTPAMLQRGEYGARVGVPRRGSARASRGWGISCAASPIGEATG
jgi:hypothetical protein